MGSLCVIVGLDGFDADVLANLSVFYRACGFEVRRSSQPRDCDLLVIQRGRYEKQVFEARAQTCHIYDYAALGSSDLHLAFPNVAKCVVIAPGERVSGNAAPENCVRSFHPVIPELWRITTTRDPDRPYQFVHIGHRKPNPSGDAWLAKMDGVARDGSCHIWGDGWPDVVEAGSAMVHGPVSLHGSQLIYRQSQFAIGVMYPFQRDTTISGRMWQAPLNGCVVYSEAMIPGRALPGVRVCDDYLSVLRAPPESPRRLELVEETTEFWDAATARVARLLELDYRRPPPWMVRQAYLEWVYARHLKGLAVTFLKRKPR